MLLRRCKGMCGEDLPLSCFDLDAGRLVPTCRRCSRAWPGAAIALIALRAHFDGDLDELGRLLGYAASTMRAAVHSPEERITPIMSLRIEAYYKALRRKHHGLPPFQRSAEEIEKVALDSRPKKTAKRYRM